MSTQAREQTIDRIVELTGRSRQQAIWIDERARQINRREELRTVEDLTPAEFATLVSRAVFQCGLYKKKGKKT